MDGVVDGRYKLRREIARGGHGLVYEAEHLVTRVRVAIKMLTPGARALPLGEPRLFREARVLGAMRHVNLVAVHDAGKCPEHGPYVVLEMIEGRPLDGILLTRQMLPVGQAVAMTIQLCDALREVHRHGVVHRDIKPANILISRTPRGDQLELIDFGIAKVPHEEELESGKLTKLGEIIGTVEYMAPEQLTDKSPVDARSDVYAAGAVLYECLSGEIPYSGGVTAIIASMLSGVRPGPIAARRGDVSLELEAVVLKALELDPAKRYASAAELAHACLSALGGVVPHLELLEIGGDRSAKPAKPAAAAVPVAPAAQPPAVPPPVVARRQYARAPYVTPVRVVGSDGAAYDGRTEDLSEGGILVVTDHGSPDNQKVKVRLPLPLSGRVVTLDAVTKWVKTRRAQRATGVEFVDAPAEVRAEIRSYVELMARAKA